jgi:hypothetical protein
MRFRRADVDRMLQNHCPSGSILLAYTSNGLAVFNRIQCQSGNGSSSPGVFPDYQLETIQFHGAQAIVKDNLAVVAVRGSYETAQGQPKKICQLSSLCPADGKWYFLADMPVANIDTRSGSPFIEPGT